MFKLPLACAALAVTALIALPGVAAAAKLKAATAIEQVGPTDISAARRHGRRHLRVTVRPAYRYGRRTATPYEVHSYDLYAHSHPYFVPGAPVYARGLRHDGMGTGAYGFGYQ